MSDLLWLWTHASTSIILGCLTYLAAARLLPTWRNVLAASAAAAAFAPIRGTDLTGLILGHLEIFSVSTVAVMLYSVRTHRQQTGTKAPESPSDSGNPHQAAIAFGMFLSCGVVLYTSAFGFTAVDVYAAGYYSEFDWAVLALSAAFAVKRCWLPAFCLTGAVIAHGFHLTDSSNLWNYLLDPWLVLASAFQLTALAWQKSVMQSETAGSDETVSIPFRTVEGSPEAKPQRRAA